MMNVSRREFLKESLAALGFAVLLSTKYNFSLLFVCAYLTAALVTRGGRYI